MFLFWHIKINQFFFFLSKVKEFLHTIQHSEMNLCYTHAELMSLISNENLLCKYNKSEYFYLLVK
jgi:hypothetical protein